MRAQEAAALIDVDNLALGGRRRPEELNLVLDQIMALTRDMPVTAAMNRQVAERYLPCLGPRGWRTLITDSTPNAADLVLLEAGRDHAACGRQSLLVASGDHTFAGLSVVAYLHVLSFEDQLSRKLRLAATGLMLLDNLITARPTAA